MEKSLIIVRGLPGSGKSTLAKKFGSRAICTADDYHTDRKGKYNWKPENVSKAHDWCQRKCRRFMGKGIPVVVVANTSTTERELKPYYDLARMFDYKVFSTIVENRHGGINTHDVPEETMDKMEKRFNIKLK
jgi:predicted kinase